MALDLPDWVRGVAQVGAPVTMLSVDGLVAFYQSPDINVVGSRSTLVRVQYSPLYGAATFTIGVSWYIGGNNVYSQSYTLMQKNYSPYSGDVVATVELPTRGDTAVITIDFGSWNVTFGVSVIAQLYDVGTPVVYRSDDPTMISSLMNVGLSVSSTSPQTLIFGPTVGAVHMIISTTSTVVSYQYFISYVATDSTSGIISYGAVALPSGITEVVFPDAGQPIQLEFTSTDTNAVQLNTMAWIE